MIWFTDNRSKKRIWFSLIITFITFFTLHAQDVDRKRTAIYISKGGMGLGYSVHLDHMLKNPVCGTWSVRIGLGSIGYGIQNEGTENIELQLLTVPVAANYLIGKNNHFFEAGIGGMPIFSDFEGIIQNDFFRSAGFNLAFFGNFGYRYQALSFGGVFRLNWTPVINKGGLSLGRFGISAGLSIN
jgi:hypothetical protein